MSKNNIKFNVTGMTCSACSAHVEKAVKKVGGIETVNVNLLTNSMMITCEDSINPSNEIIKAIEDAGYQGSVQGEQSKQGKESLSDATLETKKMKQRLILSFLFLLPLFYLSMGHMANWPLPSIFLSTENAMIFAFTQFLLCIPIVLFNEKYFRVGFKSLWKRSPNMDSLIAIGSTAAIVHGIYAIYKIGWGLGHGDMHLVHIQMMDLYFETAAMILTLVTLGKYLETKSKGKTSEAIGKLVNLMPKTALVLRDGIETEILAQDVVLGDLIIVKSGQSIPVDGIITKGSAAIDESALSGESIPAEKGVGDQVIGASINKSGYFIFEASKVGDDTTLAQMIRLVEEASASKAPISKLADKVSGVFVPVVILIAVMATIIWLLLGEGIEFALSIGIGVLVISCPCALGLATPTAIMVGMGKGAENGILIRSAEALEIAHHIDTVVLDKTGTITQGKPQVTDLLPAAGVSESELLRLAACIEKPSQHPLGNAIVEAAQNQKLTLVNGEDFIAHEGRGLEVHMEGDVYFAGNLKWMQEQNIAMQNLDQAAMEFALNGKTCLYFARNKEMLGLIAVADVVKPTSAKAVEQFMSMGIDVVMITGDNKVTAAAIQKQVGITHVIAEVMPQDKEKEIRALQKQGKKVAMIGDGINDAPALARADVGIAIGAGTDIAIESADIVLVKSDLLDAVTAVTLSKAVIKNVKQNLFWALIYNAIGIPLAAGVFYTMLEWKLNPMFGAAAMSLSSVCVVSNALRLKLFQPQNEKIQRKKENKMRSKTMKIEGMMCEHCKGRVESALSGVDGVTSLSVNLQGKSAQVILSKNVEDDKLIQSVVDAGYTVTQISEEKE